MLRPDLTAPSRIGRGQAPAVLGSTGEPRWSLMGGALGERPAAAATSAACTWRRGERDRCVSAPRGSGRFRTHPQHATGR
jgi:hypothetical protein